MSAYDITGFLRIAYRPLAYCVPSKHLLNTAYLKGGVTLILLRSVLVYNYICKFVHNVFYI